MQCLDEKDQRIKQLENENKKLLEKIKLLEHNVKILTQAVFHASKQRFGASSEKTPQIDGQYSIFGELVNEDITESEDKVINIREHKRPIRKKGDREKLIKALPHDVVECALNSNEAICKICGSKLEIIGKKKIRSEMEFVPAKLIIKDYIQYVYKCTQCGKCDANPFDMIYSAHVPAPVLTHSIAAPSTVAWIMYQKYMMSVPFYRQEKDFSRMGDGLKRDMMANWIISSSKYWLKPLYDQMHLQLLKCGVIMSDELCKALHNSSQWMTSSFISSFRR